MPDPNKHKILVEAGFKIQKVCSTCVYWTPSASDAWGRCSMLTYNHDKHTETSKKVGTPAIGFCKKYAGDKRSIERSAGSDYTDRYGGL